MEEDDDNAEEKQDYYQVEKIVDSKSVRDRKTGNHKKMYLIKWVGYSSKENTWEPIEHLANVLYMVDEYEEKRKPKNKSQDGSKDGIDGSEKLRKRDQKYQNKSHERTNLDYDDLSKNNDNDIQKSNPDLNADNLNVINSESNKEGEFGKDEPEKILGVINQINSKEWEMKVRWKKDSKTGKRPKSSIHTNTVLKRICPDLLFEFYESNVISNV